MMKAILDIFKKADLLQQSFDASIEMLETCYKMFEASSRSLRTSEAGEIDLDVHVEDSKINQYERDIRRKVLVHLTTTPARDLVFGLILVSIVIDIERIGDYCKNIKELAVAHPTKLRGSEFEKVVSELEKEVNDRFKRLIIAFRNTDSESARELMRGHRDITRKCDEIIKCMMQENCTKMSNSDAVTITLYVRYLKRVSAHITNVASGIVNPFDRIGFSE